jgi:hypothetical protein
MWRRLVKAGTIDGGATDVWNKIVCKINDMSAIPSAAQGLALELF